MSSTGPVAGDHDDDDRTAAEDGPLVRLDLVEGGVAVLTLDDAAHRNALSYALSTSLAAAVEEALAAEVGAIVLAAEPPVFCAGGSLDDLLEPKAPLRDTYVGFLAVADAPVPTVAAVAGPAIGAGVNLPLACDVVVCSPSARFDPRFLDVGIAPGGGHLWRLQRRVGAQAANALVLFGEALDGPSGVEVGLAWRCVPDDEVVDVAVTLARRAAGRPRELVRRTKAVARASLSVASADEALELELETQAWSMDQADFTDRVAALRSGRRTGR